MIKSYMIFVTLCSVVFFSACADDNSSVQAEEKEVRIITLSGFLTELIFELGYGENIVGRDVTSTYPDKVDEIPSLGHVSQLNAEAILGLNPQFIFLEEKQAESIQFLEQLKQSGVEIVVIPTRLNFDNSIHASRLIQKNLTIDDKKIREIAAKIESDSIQLEEFRENISTKPSVLFLYARGAGNIMAGGSNTSASVMIEKAGAQNAMNSFENFRAVTAESLVDAAPEVILMFSGGLKSLDEGAGLAAVPGMDQTPAYKTFNIIEMEGHYLTSFGPRSAEAALELSKKIFK